MIVKLSIVFFINNVYKWYDFNICELYYVNVFIIILLILVVDMFIYFFYIIDWYFVGV